eukprot:NODE_150_length_17275_cov_0.559618.p10 type:complete len:196 gc:universal NODE_150_length_17275_cov_0.559618:6320-6907(+)
MTGVKFAVVCASNFNRSMEGHCVMLDAELDVKSYGTGTSCKLPGKKQNQPNIYKYGEATYQEIYEDLEKQDLEFYTNNGLIKMVDRNRKIKERPEKFQISAKNHKFDVIICCEERVFDAVIEDLASREYSNHPVHVLNVEIKDNAEQAKLGGEIIRELALSFEKSSNIHTEGFKIVTETKSKYLNTRFMYCVSIN